MPIACSSDRSCTSAFSRPASISSPPKATTNVRPRCACTYGATSRSQATNWARVSTTGSGVESFKGTGRREVVPRNYRERAAAGFGQRPPETSMNAPVE